MTDRYEIVPFDDRQIMTLRNEEGIFVVMKPIAEALGLAWHGQFERIKRHPVLSKGVRVTRIPSPGGMQEATILSLEQFHGWLLTLSPDRITDEDKRDTIIRYQERAFRVVFEHFHGRIGQRLNLQSVSSRVALNNHVLTLTRKLQTTRHPAERRLTHQMLDQACTELGISTPPLDQLGADAPGDLDRLTAFWGAIDRVRASGTDLNHSVRPNLLAINLNEVRARFKAAGIRVDIDRPLMDALKLSTSPSFVDVKPVKSAIVDKTVSCWVFRLDA